MYLNQYNKLIEAGTCSFVSKKQNSKIIFWVKITLQKRKYKNIDQSLKNTVENYKTTNININILYYLVLKIILKLLNI